MKNLFLAIYRFFSGAPITPPPKHHYDQNEGDEGIDDPVAVENQLSDIQEFDRIASSESNKAIN